MKIIIARSALSDLQEIKTYYLEQGVPLRVVFEKEGRAINYQLWIGNRDAQWNALSEPKQWERMYLVCRGQYSSRWEWSEYVSGAIAGS